jgi:hypothetical protein
VWRGIVGRRVTAAKAISHPTSLRHDSQLLHRTVQLAGLLADAKRTHGAALFAGNGANVARSAPAKGIDFFAFSLYKSALKRAFSDGTNGKALQVRDVMRWAAGS